MRILHIIPSLSPRRGGATTAALDMVGALIKAGIDVEIATTNDHGQDVLDVPLSELIDYQGTQARFFARFSPPINPIREFAYSRTLAAWLKENIANYDLIHVHALFSFPSTIAMKYAREQGVPYIAHPIGSLEKWSLEQGQLKKKLYLELIEKRNLVGSKRVHFTADSERAQALIAVPNIRPIVIPLGLQLPELSTNARDIVCQRYSLDTDKLILLFLGRLHPKKGLHLLLEALATTSSSQIAILIAGEGDANYVSSLKSKIEQLDLSDLCQFTGYVSGQDKANLLQGADLFVLPSSSENFGIAVLEASASATAVMISPEVALSKVVEEHRMGWVCKNAVEDISESLQKIAHQSEAVINMGQRGREYVKQYHQWSKIAADLVSEYRVILKEAGAYS